MHFYGLSDTEVLAMPIRRFWLLHKCVDRLAAEADMRALHNAACAQGGEAFKEHSDRLQRRVGEVVRMSAREELDTDEVTWDQIDVRRDQEGFNALKQMRG
jgi:hypothetical protein